jgi:hypothetical protein
MKSLVLKSILLSIMIISSISSLAQEVELKGAMGLTFGSNKATVKKIMASKGAILMSDKADIIAYTDFPIGTLKAYILFCKFVNDKLYEIVANFDPVLEAKTQERYDEICEIISSKYGKGDSRRLFTGTYTDGDGFEMQAIRLGNADIATFWVNFKNGSGIIVEIVSINDALRVKLTYQDGVLIDDAIKRDNLKNVSDF